jgi:hypothetical protein
MSAERLKAEPLARVGLLVASSLLGLLLVEGALRLFPAVLGQEFANGVLSKYTDRQGGIYYWDPALKMVFMVPNLRTEMYYNGYRWRHKADALGFRNEKVRIPADVVLLGDSLIYGHGVDVDQTVGHHLERLSGFRVVNLARQGDCAFQQAYLATEYVGVFRPRYVVYFFFNNDITDLYGHLSDDAMREYLAQDRTVVRYPPRTDAAAARGARAATRGPWWDRLYVVKAWRFVTGRRGPPAVPSRAAQAMNDEHSLAWRYTKKAILQMKEATERQGAEFIMVPLTWQNRTHDDILARLASEHGIIVLDTRSVLASGRSFFLPGDGHFTGEGARAVAESVASFLARRAADRGRSAPASPSGRPGDPVHR